MLLLCPLQALPAGPALPAEAGADLLLTVLQCRAGTDVAVVTFHTFLANYSYTVPSELHQDPDESDSSDSAFQSARSRESRHSTKVGKKERRSAEARQSAPPPMPDRLSAEIDPLSVQMDRLSLSSSQTPSRTPNRTPSRTPSRAPSLNQVWMSRDEPYVPAAYEGPQREASPTPTPVHMLAQCNPRQGYNHSASAHPPAQNPTSQGKRPDSWGKEQGNAKRMPMAALRGHSFNDNWIHHSQDEFRPNKLRTQMSFNEMSSQNQGFSDKRSISLHGFQRDGRPPLTRRNPISAMSFNEPLTPVEQTPRGSVDSLTMSNATGRVRRRATTRCRTLATALTM